MKVTVAVRMGLAIAAFLTAGALGAQAPGGGPGFGDHRPPMERALGPRGEHGRWWNDPAMVEKLKLTDEQRKAMDGILMEHREKLIDLRANVDKAELAMEPLMGDDQPNETAILAQIDKLAQARAELEKANARFLLAIRSKLTPEQWKLLRAGRMNRMERRGWGRDRLRPGGQRPDGEDQHAAPPPPGPQGAAGGRPTVEDPGDAAAPGAGINQ
jgi:protein CpxP